jgi:hypothetical protein
MAENTNETKRVRTAELTKQINEVIDITKALRVIVDALPDSSVKDAYEYSVSNLENKNLKFLAPEQSPEQKHIAKLIREGKFSEAQEALSKISASEESDTKHEHPKRGKKSANQ